MGDGIVGRLRCDSIFYDVFEFEIEFDHISQVSGNQNSEVSTEHGRGKKIDKSAVDLV